MDTRRAQCCNACNKEGSKMVCSRCNSAAYCSKECQIKDWKERHKKVCQDFQRHANFNGPMVGPYTDVASSWAKAAHIKSKYKGGPFFSIASCFLDQELSQILGIQKPDFIWPNISSHNRMDLVVAIIKRLDIVLRLFFSHAFMSQYNSGKKSKPFDGGNYYLFLESEHLDLEQLCSQSRTDFPSRKIAVHFFSRKELTVCLEEFCDRENRIANNTEASASKILEVIDKKISSHSNVFGIMGAFKDTRAHGGVQYSKSSSTGSQMAFTGFGLSDTLDSIRDASNMMANLLHFSSPPIEAAQTMEIDMSTGSIKVFDMDQRHFNVQYSIDGESNVAFESVKQQVVDYERMNGREFSWSDVEKNIFKTKH